MKIESLSHEHVGLPSFSNVENSNSSDVSYDPPATLTQRGVEVYDNYSLTLFDLSSHSRAREAIHFGLKMRDKGFHVFVVGEDRSGRMTATLTYLKQYIKTMQAPLDLVYLNNFSETHRPKPYSLPAGLGAVLVQKTKDLIKNIQVILNKMTTNPHYLRQIDSLSASLDYQIEQQIAEVKHYAHERGYEVTQNPDGFNVELRQDANFENDKDGSANLQDVKDRLNRISLSIHLTSQKINKKAEEIKQNTAQKSIHTLIQKFQEEFGIYLGGWIDELKNDILNRIDDFLDDQIDEGAKRFFNLEEWYGVNLFVDHRYSKHPKVILEAHPTYENLFGSIKYRTSASGAVETNFTMIRPGAFHMANGGILVLRAEALAQDPELWEFIKGALRDQVIRIEERVREGGLPLLNAPEPHSVALDVQVFLVASPSWYYTFFFNDPDFRSYFKIKADIDPDLPATPENITVYRQLIKQNAISLTGLQITEDAIDYLMGYSARWVGHREKLSARFELVADILTEAGVLSEGDPVISKDTLIEVINLRRLRNASVEDRTHQEIAAKQVLIDTKGFAIGQINGLAVLGTGDHNYGMPSRISARTYAGEEGVVNIERLTEMGGPIQQKAALILEGFLNALFAQRFPLSYCCSLTFEQNYGDIEGDSASLAEVAAIISSLSGFPIRQDIGITGSMNQFGLAQSIGGVHYKIEGFHRVCTEQGLSGTQGVIIPYSNCKHLTLRENVVEDVRQGKFSIWPVKSIFQAIEILTNKECGLKLCDDGMPMDTQYPHYRFTRGSIFSAIAQRLEQYNKAVKSGHR
ncbi:MAG: AAA family ATPase [Alphaproteobacteria bacterium]|nr:AAA family ATPase [Alphaproteobacteria bacterium]